MPREFFGSKFSEEGEEEALKNLYEEAVSKYEETLGVPPPKDWTAEQITEAMEKKAAHQDKTLAEIHKPSGLKSRRLGRPDRRGHRRGLKPVKHREAA